MNKKLLICGAIAAALVLTACVKKEEPKQDEPKQAETTTQVETTVIEPAPMQPLEPIESTEPEIPANVEIERQETANTTTEIRREVQAAEATASNTVQAPAQVEPPKLAPTSKVETPKAPAAKVESKPAPSKATNSNTQSEDDAIAAAIAAATPALNN